MMIVLALLFAWSILLNGSSFAAIHGRWAQRLELPGSVLIPWVAWAALVAYVLAVVVIHRIKTPRERWLSFAAVTLLGNFVVGYPVALLDHGSVRIPVSHHMSRESQQALGAKYPDLKWVTYSASREGNTVRVRRDDYTPELAAFVTGLVDDQAEKRSGGTAR